jgi:hypothetical protein
MAIKLAMGKAGTIAVYKKHGSKRFQFNAEQSKS